MTTRAGSARRHTAMWMLAPVAVGVFGLSTDWAVRHNPLATDEAAAPAAAVDAPADSGQRRTRALEDKLAAATEQYAATRRTLLGVERSLRRGESELAALQGKHSPAPAADSAPAVAAPPALPPPAAPPAPPPVDTSTGAS